MLYNTPLFKNGNNLNIGGVISGSEALAILNFSQEYKGTTLVIANDISSENNLLNQFKFYKNNIEILHFSNYETLVYDNAIIHQDIISNRIKALNSLSKLKPTKQLIIVTTLETLLSKITPVEFIKSRSFSLSVGEILEISDFTKILISNGYLRVNKVEISGEFSIRGSIIDIYPLGQKNAVRIDLLDNEIDEIRIFNSKTQLSIEKITNLEILPAKEFSFDKTSREFFLQNYLTKFSNKNSHIYQSIESGILPNGIESYLPLFFEKSTSLIDYLPESSVICYQKGISARIDELQTGFDKSYISAQTNLDFPPLKTGELFFAKEQIFEKVKTLKKFIWQSNKLDNGFNLGATIPATVKIHNKSLDKLESFLKITDKKVLIVLQSTSRISILLELLQLEIKQISSFKEFIQTNAKINIIRGDINDGFILDNIAVLSENNIFGNNLYQQKRRRRAKHKDFNEAIKSLIEINSGDCVVHENYGVGRYVGLNTQNFDGIDNDFIEIEYCGNAKLFVPIDEISLISRYSGGISNPKLHKLGTQTWNNAKKKAVDSMRDVASELLNIYAKRELEYGFSIGRVGSSYDDFVADFAFEETEDQIKAADDILTDMQTDKPMDRIICGDVGFGKTEIAMRASFLTADNNSQVAILTPTTLLANQHYKSFIDRFKNFAINIAVLSRFQSQKEQNKVKENLKNGTVDIVIGTHKLIQNSIEYKNLGLVIIDEEHRFGVNQKEKFKDLRSSCNILTMSATPIPRTLNLALSSLRAISIISTPPKSRVAVQTFVCKFDEEKIKEAISRELHRGGQIFFLHNDIDSIDNMAENIKNITPKAKVRVAHGQMPSVELEAIMNDFYHQRFQILVCTTIIETGIDIPTANTIIVNNANNFGLSQLHQLRGRVGRSHHKAYAYLMVKDFGSITKNAQKRLEAIESLEALGAGFMLANHDLEIRGAGDILGKNQSGKISEIGFSLYYDLLERTIKSLKNNKTLDLKKNTNIKIDLGISIIIPSDYIFDVAERLSFYQKIDKDNNIREIELEMIDRFGLMPDSCKNLFAKTNLQSLAIKIGVKSINAFVDRVLIKFDTNAKIDFTKIITLIQQQSKTYKLKDQTTLIYFYKDLDDINRIKQIHSLLTSVASL